MLYSGLAHLQKYALHPAVIGSSHSLNRPDLHPLQTTLTKVKAKLRHRSLLMGHCEPIATDAFADSFRVNHATAERAPPEGFVLHCEGTTSILLAKPLEKSTKNTALSKHPKQDSQISLLPASGELPEVFLNPVQEYNRDLSVACITTWSEIRQSEKAAVWEKSQRARLSKKRKKLQRDESDSCDTGTEVEVIGYRRSDIDLADAKKHKTGERAETSNNQPIFAEDVSFEAAKLTEDQSVSKPPTYKFTLLEALSATGLRAIRYAKEIPLLRYVVANDLSSSAVRDIKRNIDWNGMTPPSSPFLDLPLPLSELEASQGTFTEMSGRLSFGERQDVEDAKLGKVRVNEGDACDIMYRHRSEEKRFDCVDLDPYGTAVPFLDAAIGSVADGGLLCVTCTDTAVFAGHNYPEKCFSAYGGVCVNAEFSHEVGLRLVLHAIATTAGRYGRYIEPLLSLSIDFYVRLFIRIRTSPKEVKYNASKTSLLYYCHDCHSTHLQAFGRNSEKVNKVGQAMPKFHVAGGPPTSEECSQCGHKFHVAGPMWSGAIHSQQFVNQVLEHVTNHKADFNTAERLKGMLTVAKSELDAPFYFTTSRVCSAFQATVPPNSVFASALLNSGYLVSRSHAIPGCIKTNAPHAFVLDIVREWIKDNPIKMTNVKEGSAAFRLLRKPQTYSVDLTPHPDVRAKLLDDVKIVRYQHNPDNWGPRKAAIRGAK